MMQQGDGRAAHGETSGIRRDGRRDRRGPRSWSVREVTAVALDAALPLAPMEVALAEARDCIAAVDVAAPGDVPPVDVVAHDGYAVRRADLADGAATDAGSPGWDESAGPDGSAGPSESAAGPVTLRVLAEVRPGDADPAHVVRGTAVRVFSGVPLPTGADLVVPTCHTDRGAVTVAIDPTPFFPPTGGGGVRRAGSGLRAGSVAVPAGTRLAPRHLALLAELGPARVRVHPRPRVAVLAVGDEIVDLGRPATLAQRRDATGVAVSGILAEVGAAPFRVVGIPDSVTAIRDAVDDQVVRADVIVLVGGLSGTVADVVPAALAGLGTLEVMRVESAPAVTLGVGRLGPALRSRPVFALPGDPAAALVAVEAFLRPALRTMTGASRRTRPAIRAESRDEWRSPQGQREFVGVRVRGSGTSDDPYTAMVVAPADGLSLAGLARANALAVVPEDVTEIRRGDAVACALLDG